MPEEWKTRNFENNAYVGAQTILNFAFSVPGFGHKKLRDLTLKEIYQILLLKEKCHNSSKIFWANKFPDGQIDWGMWFKFNFVNKLLPRKIRDSNWKIFYGQVNTETRLKRMRFSDCICKLCTTESENLEHLLVYCKEVVDVWKEMETVLKYIDDTINIDLYLKLCGFFENGIYGDLINMIISVTRWILWKRRNRFKYENEYLNASKTTKDAKVELGNHVRTLLLCKNGPIVVQEMIKKLIEHKLLM